MSGKIYLEPAAAQRLNAACKAFSESVMQASDETTVRSRARGGTNFRSAIEIDGVYSTCAGQALPRLMDDFGSQASAMAALFQIAGGNLSAQDEEAASALKNAASAPPSINGPSMAIPGLSAISALDNEASRTDKFSWVSGEDASGMSLEAMKTGAESLSPGDLRSTADHFSTASRTLSSAADELLASVNHELGSSWQGEFADTAIANVTQFHGSATELAGQLTTVADRANALAAGYEFTRERVGGITPDAGDQRDSDTAASREAARQDAQRVIHSDYNPSLESANLSELSFTPAHRVGNAGGAGITDVPPVSLWNRDVPPPAGGMAAAGGSGVDAHTTLASSGGSVGGGASGGSAPAGGASTPAGAGSPSTANASAPGVAASGVIPSGVGGTASGTARQASGNAPSPGFGRSGATASSPGAGAGAARNEVGGSRSVTGSSPGTVARASSGASSAPLSGRLGMAGGGSGAISGSSGFGSSRGSSPFAAGSGGAASTAGGTSGSSGSSGAAPRAGIGTGAASANGAGSGPSAVQGTAGASRMGGPMMGAMPMAGGAKSGDKAHAPADYLVHPSHSSELIGNLPAAVRPVLRGSRAPEE